MTETATAEATAAEEKQEEKKAAKPEKLEFEHLKLMKEENITIKDLPKDIKQKMNGVNMLVKKYNKNPTEALLLSIKKNDVLIADMIQTFREKDIQEETEEQKKAREEAEAKAAQDKKDEEAKAEKERKLKENPQYELEEKITASLNDKGQISERELSKILGRKVKKFDGVEKIGNLTLKNKWLTEIWEKVS